MSYDIYLSQRGTPAEEQETRPLPLDAGTQRFAQDLSARDPRLHAWVAVTVIELTRVDAPIQLSLWQNEAVVSIGLGSVDERRDVSLTEGLGYVQDIQRHFGWRAYDSQLEREVRLPDDIDAVTRQFLAAGDVVNELGRGQP
jgi:hypothetical protein